MSSFAANQTFRIWHKDGNGNPNKSITVISPRAMAGFTDLCGELRNKVYALVLPDFKDLYPTRDMSIAISLHEFKPYMEEYGTIFQLNRQIREDTLSYFFARHNVGVVVGIGDEHPDQEAIYAFGLGYFQTLYIDVPLYEPFRVLTLLGLLADADRVKHLYLNLITGYISTAVPWRLDTTRDVLDKVADLMGEEVGWNLQQVEDIHIDLPYEQSVARFDWLVAEFLSTARSNELPRSASEFMKIIIHALFLGKPEVEICSLQDEKTFGKDFWA